MFDTGAHIAAGPCGRAAAPVTVGGDRGTAA